MLSFTGICPLTFLVFKLDLLGSPSSFWGLRELNESFCLKTI